MILLVTRADSLLTLMPIFHWKMGLLWIPNANEINTKNMKCTWPTPAPRVGHPANLYSTCSRWGFAWVNANFRVGVGGNANFSVFRYQHVGIGNAKSLRWGSNPTRGPNASGFASQWNIVFTYLVQQTRLRLYPRAHHIPAGAAHFAPRAALCLTYTNEYRAIRGYIMHCSQHTSRL